MQFNCTACCQPFLLPKDNTEMGPSPINNRNPDGRRGKVDWGSLTTDAGGDNFLYRSLIILDVICNFL